MSVTTYDLGTVLMVPKGDWSASVSYERLNLVRHNGTAWLCVVAAGQTSLNHEPSANSADWEILVQDQSSVTSVNGQRGDVVIDESGLVHKAGTETITGDKTFSGTVTAVTPSADDESDKVATTEWVKNTTLTNAVGGGGNNLFDVKWSDHRLNDMSWLRSDTFSWHNGDVYSAAYQELLSEYTNRTDQTVYKAFVKSNYTAVGSNIKEWRGIVQGFKSNTDYITHPVAQPTTSMEYVIKIYASVLGTTQYVLGGNGNAFTLGPIFQVVNATTGQMNLHISTNGSSWNVANNVNTNCTLPANTWKWFKLVWNGSTFTISESLNGIDYEQKYSVACTAAPKFETSNTKVLGCSTATATNAFNTGKFDLQECYFKADGNLVWSGADYLDYVITDKKYRVVLPSQTENLQRIYNDYGVAWYYVLDSTNERFKLPRTKFGFTGLRSGVGKEVEAGLPNIEGQTTSGYGSSTLVNTGAFIKNGVSYASQASGSYTETATTFDASRFSSIYSNSDTVQPPATEMYLYHYVGDFNRQAVLANIGVTSENIDSTSFLNTPVGTIIWSMANSVPAGYLVCNGQAVGRLAYPELFSAIGTTYGEGDGDSTFNLPNLIGKFVEGASTAGIEHEAGLPNIEGSFAPGVTSNIKCGFGNGASGTGSFIAESNGTNGYIMKNSDAYAEQHEITFNASLSNSIYGNSNTVQPPSLTAMPCIKAFDAVTNEGTVEVSELINGIEEKVALDGSNLSNVSNTFKEYLVHSIMPSDRYVELAAPTALGETKVMPDDGWLRYSGIITGSNGYLRMINTDDESNYIIDFVIPANITNGMTAGLMPVSKGDRVSFYYYYANTLTLRLIYPNGSSHLASSNS